MKRRPTRKLAIAGLLALFVIACALGIPSIQQNSQVRRHIEGLFTAIRTKDRDTVINLYHRGVENIPQAYYDQLFRYPLKGWKITRITGQPWPMDRMVGTRHIYADLYYDLPDRLLAPQGKYQPIDHPQYGKCGVVPVDIDEFNTNGEWRMVLPAMESEQFWLAPYEGKEGFT